jgi:hypothetical protein
VIVYGLFSLVHVALFQSIPPTEVPTCPRTVILELEKHVIATKNADIKMNVLKAAVIFLFMQTPKEVMGATGLKVLWKE